MRTLLFVLALGIGTVLSAACVSAPNVVQGIVVRYEASSKTVVVQDEREPHQEFVISVEGAEIGADPVVQDEVRIAYRDKGGHLVATRVMNLTRQKEVGKLDKKH
jgi:hypothetical protein